MKKLNPYLMLPLSVAFLVLGGCASSHDLKQGAGTFGGGVMHEELKPGLFLVRSQTNWAPWPNLGSARSAWEQEARTACKGKNWKEVNTKEGTRDTGLPSMGLLPYLVSEKRGYALCDDSQTSEAEALKLAN
jgi:hypothetical protein